MVCFLAANMKKNRKTADMIQQFETTDDEKGAVFNDSGISGESFGSADVAEGDTSTNKFGNMFKKNLSRSESLKSKVKGCF